MQEMSVNSDLIMPASSCAQWAAWRSTDKCETRVLIGPFRRRDEAKLCWTTSRVSISRTQNWVDEHVRYVKRQTSEPQDRDRRWAEIGQGRPPRTDGDDMSWRLQKYCFAKHHFMSHTTSHTYTYSNGPTNRDLFFKVWVSTVDQSPYCTSRPVFLLSFRSSKR